MKRSAWLLAALGTMGAFTVAAQGCGSDEEGAQFTEDGGSSGASGASGASGTSGASGASGNGGFTSGGASGTSGDNGDGAACQAATTKAEKLPLTMLIAFDQSASMGNTNGYTNKATRWDPVTTAMKAFWLDASTAGISANLRLFPHDNTKATSCQAPAYVTPDVDLTPLPSPVFATKLVADPNFTFTPTRAVLESTAAQAESLLAADPNGKVVVVLVTDGTPEQCDNNNAGNSIGDASSRIANKPFKTYVIGIGGQAGLEANINALATAGGTTPFFLQTGNAAETQQAFTNAMNEIRSKLASCEVPIPAPPANQSFDREKVNVTITSGTGVSTDLGYDPTCAGAGWKYDDPAAPTLITLCPATCEPVTSDPGSSVNVAFGCTTRAVVN